MSFATNQTDMGVNFGLDVIESFTLLYEGNSVLYLQVK